MTTSVFLKLSKKHRNRIRILKRMKKDHKLHKKKISEVQQKNKNIECLDVPILVRSARYSINASIGITFFQNKSCELKRRKLELATAL